MKAGRFRLPCCSSLPLGLFGALLAVYLRDYPYDIYTQIGIVTLIGLAAKNAILIVEFAKDSHEREVMSVSRSRFARGEAAAAAHSDDVVRIHPGRGAAVVATGAGSASRRSLGTAVFGGMIAATLLAVFFVPVQYFVIESFVERREERSLQTQHEPQTVGADRLMRRFVFPLLLTLGLCGCLVGPNYQSAADQPAHRNSRALPPPKAIRSRTKSGLIFLRTQP